MWGCSSAATAWASVSNRRMNAGSRGERGVDDLDRDVAPHLGLDRPEHRPRAGRRRSSPAAGSRGAARPRRSRPGILPQDPLVERERARGTGRSRARRRAPLALAGTQPVRPPAAPPGTAPASAVPRRAPEAGAGRRAPRVSPTTRACSPLASSASIRSSLATSRSSFEPGRLGDQRRVVGQVGERRTAPECERVVERARPQLRDRSLIALRASRRSASKRSASSSWRVDLEPVAGGPALDRSSPSALRRWET